MNRIPQEIEPHFPYMDDKQQDIIITDQSDAKEKYLIVRINALLDDILFTTEELKIATNELKELLNVKGSNNE